MAKISSKVANWLYSVLQPQYLHKEIAYSHLYHFLSAYLPEGFKIRTAVYTSVSGHSQLLINLYGNLDCGTCLVPLNIWIPLNYPFQDENIPSHEPNGVPEVFVVPEHGLVIRPNNNVDSQGRFYHPFIASWHQNYTPTSSTKQFSLLSLMGCLKATFEQTPPLDTRPSPSAAPSGPPAPPKVLPNQTGPQLPPKRAYNEPEQAKSPTPVAQTPEPPRRETTGPPLPQKPISRQATQDTSIPEKYRMPLPLPGENVPTPPPAQQPVSPPSFQHPISPPSFQRPFGSPQYERPVHAPVQATGPAYIEDDSDIYEPHRPQSVKPSAIAEVEDLMDKVTVNETKNDKPILQELSAKVNAFLESEESVFQAMPFVEEQKAKVNALHSQLSNHLKQAQANDENLQKHVSYLSGQIEAVKRLNGELQQLDQINAQSKDEISTGTAPGQSIKLDDLITPDSILVNQLYETVADIKAHKDTIDLVGGNFKGEKEVINDENMDTCIKSVRGLARELFWLEVTKSEIGKSMGLRM
ncbi:hypothetical protein FT663_01705 [Candidozyma haemuli var. vulneris]|uniref:UEV domain-containing protein n=1 Tax=Candidozyma haemuli TaxID=45357 RepID=A0A2V1AYX7_9ASCO|nr:hypothetical protein CXQ85_003011 [[Candida] haemuloni]KAF3991270.1 hypothetical protein FT662_01821 [[Candida] haemuloni var. vulneris]KAF3993805.1 hypothetical protein FT663_01705 [[Candida] haemuloni var. vulneris]PVH23277.1 hypothetical protein CXQ85_003011 [[Candida] haemuloni]